MTKTVKYEMYINTFGMSGNIIPISKKVFNETIKNYKEQVEESKNLDRNLEYVDYEDYELNMRTSTTEHEKYIETLYSFHDDGTAICLRKLECKEGYHWK